MTPALNTLVTPTGLLVSDLDPVADREEWLQVRRLGIGSSDIPALVGCSTYKTPLHVWLDKRGELPDEGPHESALWGNVLEDPVAQEWARQHRAPVRRVGTLAHIEHPWVMASLDRLVMACPDRADLAEYGDTVCGLEVKTRSAFKAGQWSEDLPDDVLAQTQWQLVVTGLDHMHVACLIGGQSLKNVRVDPDPDVQAYIRATALALWEHVQDATPPEVDPSGMLLDLLDQLHPHRAGEVELEPAMAEAWLAEYADAHEELGKAEARKVAAKAALVAVLGDGDAARVGDRIAFTYRPQNRSHVDTDALRTKYPDAYKATVSKRPTRPVFLTK